MNALEKFKKLQNGVYTMDLKKCGSRGTVELKQHQVIIKKDYGRGFISSAYITENTTVSNVTLIEKHK